MHTKDNVSDSAKESAKINAQEIPAELRATPHWVCWRRVQRDGKTTKVPYDPKTGYEASSTNPDNWASFEVASAAAPEYAGIGFVFTNDYIGIDLDGAVEWTDGVPQFEPWATAILDRCVATYIEYSPSRTGLHIISRGRLPEGWTGRKRDHHDGVVELYSRARYFTFTADRLDYSATEITDISSYALELYVQIGGAPTSEEPDTAPPTSEPADRPTERLAAAMRDEKFAKLFDGDITDYPSASEADLAFCSKAAFYAAGDADLIEEWALKSSLVRDKWTLRKHYLRGTINKAVRSVTAQYKFKDKLPPLPEGYIVLPNDHCTYSQSAETVYTVLGKSGRFFVRGKVVVELTTNGLESVTPEALRSRLDRYGERVVAFVVYKEQLVAKPKRCSRDQAVTLLVADEATELLPEITLLTRMPIIVPCGKDSKILENGYHADYRVLIRGNDTIDDVPKDKAVQSLLELLVDFNFGSDGDRARAVAEIMTPALRMGRWFDGPSPIHSSEADYSQSGKTLRQEMTRAIYGERSYLVAQREGGVGSLDESLSMALLSGRPFVALDNIRGKLDSKFLEAAITWNELVGVRVPYRGETQIDCTLINFQLTSNGIEATRDLANRCSITRIKKQKKDHPFKMGRVEIVSHITSNRRFYLGCVFSIVRHWALAGRPMLKTVNHDFKEWACVLGWITENIFGIPGLMDGHEEAQIRVSNPALSWLRNVCIAAEHGNLIDKEMLAHEIAELCENEAVEIPGLKGTADEEQAWKQVGKLLARCFKASDDSTLVKMDGFFVARKTTKEIDSGYRNKLVHRYLFSRLDPKNQNPLESTTPLYPPVETLSKKESLFLGPRVDRGVQGGFETEEEPF